VFLSSFQTSISTLKIFVKEPILKSDLVSHENDSVKRSSFFRKHQRLIILVCFILVVWAVPWRIGIVSGASMEPNFHSGQAFILSRSVHPQAVKRGDVLVLDVAGATIVKRVSALPGDTVWCLVSSDDGGSTSRLLAADEVDTLRQLSASHPAIGHVVTQVIPVNHVFVTGDAPDVSEDSRSFGAVSLDAVMGRVVLPVS
jgi:signal peptidase I